MQWDKTKQLKKKISKPNINTINNTAIYIHSLWTDIIVIHSRNSIVKGTQQHCNILILIYYYIKL